MHENLLARVCRGCEEWREEVLLDARELVPLDEVHPAPQLSGATGLAGHYRLEMAHDLGMIQEGDAFAVPQPITHGVGHAGQPAVFGRFEADLVAPVEHFVGHDAAHCGPEYALGLAAR